ncbi:uncharacterized protein LOC129926580 [Biomphalaria glabrata]|uniref:Uncharacterized protein LOC129926580 n=1 Tax=Biomphalaria glabrata TaxID=6526 RepID=A0A9W3AJY1_BIOGL|nr:uncharacterized protein LOC129926580 [Biomphalaria glabrata]
MSVFNPPIRPNGQGRSAASNVYSQHRHNSPSSLHRFLDRNCVTPTRFSSQDARSDLRGPQSPHRGHNRSPCTPERHPYDYKEGGNQYVTDPIRNKNIADQYLDSYQETRSPNNMAVSLAARNNSLTYDVVQTDLYRESGLERNRHEGNAAMLEECSARCTPTFRGHHHDDQPHRFNQNNRGRQLARPRVLEGNLSASSADSYVSGGSCDSSPRRFRGRRRNYGGIRRWNNEGVYPLVKSPSDSDLASSVQYCNSFKQNQRFHQSRREGTGRYRCSSSGAQFPQTSFDIQILKSFESYRQLEDAVYQHFGRYKSIGMTVDQNSIVRREGRGFCSGFVHTDVQPIAEGIVQNLCSRMKDSLKVDVQYRLS